MRETRAKTIADLLLSQSADQTEMLKTIEDAAPDDVIEAPAMIAAKMGAIDLDALRRASHPEAARSGLRGTAQDLKRRAISGGTASWFETPPRRLLTMRLLVARGAAVLEYHAARSHTLMVRRRAAPSRTTRARQPEPRLRARTDRLSKSPAT